MPKQKTLQDVRQSIRIQIQLSRKDLFSDVQYIRDSGRGRFSALSILCDHMGFTELEVEIERALEESFDSELQLIAERKEAHK